MSRRVLQGAFALTCCVILVAWTTPAFAQRPAGGGQAAPLDAAHVLENFGEIVEMIWTDEEASAWERLQTDDERQAFIVSFWEARDPSPDSSENEFRILYMARVQDAYSRFTRGDDAGYTDPRGKVLIIYGGAITLQEIRQVGASTVSAGGMGDPTRETDPRPEDSEAARTQRLVWEMDVSKNPYLEGKEEIQFTQGRGGFDLNTGGIEFSQEAFLANTDVQAYFAGDASAGGVASGGGGAAPVPPDFVAMRELLNNGTARTDLTLDAELRFFPAPQNTYTVLAFNVGRDGLTFGEDGDDPASLKVFGLLYEVAPSGEETRLRQMRIDFESSPEAGSAETTGTHSMAMILIPGSYRLLWGIMDNASERIVTMSEEFDAPDLAGDGLALSSIVLSRPPAEVTPDEPDLDTVYSGMRIFKVELDVDVSNSFAPDDEMEILYMVAGAEEDPDTEQVELLIDTVIMTADGTPIARLPTEMATEMIISNMVPLAQIPGIEAGGSYKIEVTVKDLIGGRQVTGEVMFSGAEGR
jgi:GWxTD domain-containing protein